MCHGWRVILYIIPFLICEVFTCFKKMNSLLTGKYRPYVTLQCIQHLFMWKKLVLLSVYLNIYWIHNLFMWKYTCFSHLFMWPCNGFTCIILFCTQSGFMTSLLIWKISVSLCENVLVFHFLLWKNYTYLLVVLLSVYMKIYWSHSLIMWNNIWLTVCLCGLYDLICLPVEYMKM